MCKDIHAQSSSIMGVGSLLLLQHKQHKQHTHTQHMCTTAL